MKINERLLHLSSELDSCADEITELSIGFSDEFTKDEAENMGPLVLRLWNASNSYKEKFQEFEELEKKVYERTKIYEKIR